MDKSRSLGLAVRGNESLERVQLLLKRGGAAEALLTAEAEAEAEARDEAIAERESSREREGVSDSLREMSTADADWN